MENNKKEELKDSEKELKEKWENLKNDLNNARGGTSILGLLGVAFVILKLCAVINWSWWWVLAPFWAPFAFIAVLLLIVMICALVAVCFVKDLDYNNVDEEEIDNTQEKEEETVAPMSVNLETVTPTKDIKVEYIVIEDTKESEKTNIEEGEIQKKSDTKDASTLTTTSDKSKEIKNVKSKPRRRNKSKKDEDGGDKKSTNKNESGTEQSK